MQDLDLLVTELHAEGFVRLETGFDPAAASDMRLQLWRELGAVESDPSTWPSGRQGKTSKRAPRASRTSDAFWSKDVVSAVDALLGRDSWTRPAAGELLLTFPEPSEPLRQLDPFHSDFAMDVPDVPLFAVEIFAFIGVVPPRSGGTLVLRASHRVAKRFIESLPPGFPRHRAATQFAADNPWLTELGVAGLIGATHDCDGIEVRVEELTGAPGDVVITHPWTLHAGISSQGTAPRVMLRHRIFRTSTLSPPSV